MMPEQRARLDKAIRDAREARERCAELAAKSKVSWLRAIVRRVLRRTRTFTVH